MGLLASPLLWLGGRSCWTNYKRHPKHFKFKLLYRLWVWADLCVYLSIYHPLVNSPNPLVRTRAECICAFIWFLELMNNETAIALISLLLGCRVYLCVHLNARAHEQWNCNSGNQSFVAYIREWRFHCHVLI